ncbi:MAG: endopeptidase La [Chloroflexi bacterium]|nr:MAG: endopeptidase La [Chloroflexota bacterium]TMC72435.1 MAG: endopeptidase La [Chloroflexota bacterium]
MPAVNLEGAVPSHLPVLPLKSTVVFPRIFIPLSVGRKRSLQLLEDLSGAERHIAVATQLNEEAEEVGFSDIHHIGAMVRVQHMLKLPDGTVQLAVLGLRRIRLTGAISEDPYMTCAVEMLPETRDTIPALEREALMRRAISSFQQLVTLAPHLPAELSSGAAAIDDPLHLAYYIANHTRLTTEQRQEILELDSSKVKLERLLGHMAHELEVLELGRKIQSQAEESMGKAQREYFLREQLKAIQRELGELDSEVGEMGELRERIVKAGLPPEAQREADREIGRLERIPSASPESSVIRTYLELIVSLPWNTSTGGEVDVVKAREILDADHYDLDKVKQRIVEHLAVRRLKQQRKSTERGREPILCFVGPPGVGKTSLGQSIARAMGRKFARASLGGVHDEAEIRGHRRTYIGAMPGRILQAIRRAESNDPVFILDEVDKIGSDWRGDPSSALLEVLDPEQNKDFRDNYLDVPFDLSKVMFITTANSLETIPPALRDRMEVLNLSGYTEAEKVQIAERFLVPKQLLAHGLRPREVALTEDAVRAIIREYTREAGVRNLEREIASVMRRTVADIAVGKRPRKAVDVKRVRAALGKRRHYDDVRERIDRPGVATGLVWTPTGGEIIFVEAALTPGKGELKLTGQLGEVMKESAAAALSYLKARASDIGIDPTLFDKNDIHIHVPAGAQPKEGPSAGVTVLTAIASILTGRPARDDIAMTGEITLRGRVLPIGGIKEKVLGAHRAGIRRVLLPTRNEADLDDIPADLRRQMQLVLVDSIDQVLREALTKVPEAPRQRSNGARAPGVREPVAVAAPARESAHARKAPRSRPAAKARRRRGA